MTTSRTRTLPRRQTDSVATSVAAPESPALSSRPTRWVAALLFLVCCFGWAAILEAGQLTQNQFAFILVLLPASVMTWIGLLKMTRSFSSTERPQHSLVIVGRNLRTRHYLHTMDQMPHQSLNVVGVLDAEGAEDGTGTQACDELMKRHEVPHLGAVDSLRSVLSQNPIDEVLITLPIKSFYDQIGECLQVCHDAGVPVSLSTDFFGLNALQPGLLSWGGDAVRLNYARSRHPRWKLALKRAMDICGALAGLAIFGLPMAIAAVLIKLTSDGPVFFAQERAGLHHKPFKVLKFRTMVVDAEKIRLQIEHLNEQDGPVFKIKHDPRITGVGRFLRKYSLDELPQLFNVLVGDMSLVGPRPPIPSEVSQYEWWQRRRLSAKPGLTCFWQVSARNTVEFEEWMRLDLDYIDNWSLWLDVKLVFQTIPVMIRGSGC